MLLQMLVVSPHEDLLRTGFRQLQCVGLCSHSVRMSRHSFSKHAEPETQHVFFLSSLNLSRDWKAGWKLKMWGCPFHWLQSWALVGFWTCCWPLLSWGKLPRVQLTSGTTCPSLPSSLKVLYLSFLCGTGVKSRASSTFAKAFWCCCFFFFFFHETRFSSM